MGKNINLTVLCNRPPSWQQRNYRRLLFLIRQTSAAAADNGFFVHEFSVGGMSNDVSAADSVWAKNAPFPSPTDDPWTHMCRAEEDYLTVAIKPKKRQWPTSESLGLPH